METCWDGNKIMKEIEKCHFFKMNKWYFDSGAIKYLSGTEAKVFLALLRRASWKSNEGKMRNLQIVREANISQGSIKKAIQKLVMIGLIEVWMKGNMRNYRIIRNCPADIVQRVEYFRKENEEIRLRKLEKKRDELLRDKNGKFTGNDVGIIARNSDFDIPI